MALVYSDEENGDNFYGFCRSQTHLVMSMQPFIDCAYKTEHLTGNSVTADNHENTEQFLQRIREGDDCAVKELFDLLYDELKAMAFNKLKQERDNHTLHPTELVHETYIRLFSKTPLLAENRYHFFAIVNRAMFQLLVEYARKKKFFEKVPSWDLTLESMRTMNGFDIEELHLALTELKEISERKHAIVTLRFFDGLKFKEIKEHLNIKHINTVEKDWAAARAWLYGRLRREQ